MTLPADPLEYPLRLWRLHDLAVASEYRAPACSWERQQRAARADRIAHALRHAPHGDAAYCPHCGDPYPLTLPTCPEPRCTRALEATA